MLHGNVAAAVMEAGALLSAAAVAAASVSGARRTVGDDLAATVIFFALSQLVFLLYCRAFDLLYIKGNVWDKIIGERNVAAAISTSCATLAYALLVGAAAPRCCCCSCSPLAVLAFEIAAIVYRISLLTVQLHTWYRVAPLALHRSLAGGRRGVQVVRAALVRDPRGRRRAAAARAPARAQRHPARRPVSQSVSQSVRQSVSQSVSQSVRILSRSVSQSVSQDSQSGGLATGIC
eukprot:SAG22_NODE_3739_length_1551_cov_1.185262_2_plen_234_part_00